MRIDAAAQEHNLTGRNFCEGLARVCIAQLKVHSIHNTLKIILFFNIIDCCIHRLTETSLCDNYNFTLLSYIYSGNYN